MSTKQLKKMSPLNQQKSGIHPWTKEPLWEPHRKLVQSKQEESHLGKAPSSTQVSVRGLDYRSGNSSILLRTHYSTTHQGNQEDSHPRVLLVKGTQTSVPAWT